MKFYHKNYVVWPQNGNDGHNRRLMPDHNNNRYDKSHNSESNQSPTGSETRPKNMNVICVMRVCKFLVVCPLKLIINVYSTTDCFGNNSDKTSETLAATGSFHLHMVVSLTWVAMKSLAQTLERYLAHQVR